MPPQNAVQQFYFRVIIGISVAGVAAIIPGFLEIRLSWLKNGIRASGAIAVFVFIYLFNPATINDDDFRPSINLSGEWNFYFKVNGDEIPGGFARISHRDGSNVFIINGDVEANPQAPPDAYNAPHITFDSDYALINERRVVFHYKTNEGEEGVAVASYNSSANSQLIFYFRDFEETDDDGFPSGILIFKRISTEAETA